MEYPISGILTTSPDNGLFSNINMALEGKYYTYQEGDGKEDDINCCFLLHSKAETEIDDIPYVQICLYLSLKDFEELKTNINNKTTNWVTNFSKVKFGQLGNGKIDELETSNNIEAQLEQNLTEQCLDCRFSYNESNVNFRIPLCI